MWRWCFAWSVVAVGAGLTLYGGGMGGFILLATLAVSWARFYTEQRAHNSLNFMEIYDD